MKQLFSLINFFLVHTICLFFLSISAHGLTVEEIVRLKAAGVDDKSIQLLIERETSAQDGSREMGVNEIERPDGGKDKIYYSITSPGEEMSKEEVEKEKLEKSLDMLRNLILDQRRE